MTPEVVRGRVRSFLTLLAVLGCTGCGWISLAVHAVGYPVTSSGEAANVVVSDEFAYVTRAGQGLEILDLESNQSLKIIPPPSGSESIDDVAVADGLLFVLDARPPGHLSIYSLGDPAAPMLRSGPVDVPVGPFSGVAAAAGRVIVSGGTSELTLRTYDAGGRLEMDVASADFGRGQPDILLAPDGTRAFVSTHFRGPHFGLTTVTVATSPASMTPAGMMDLDTIGFTAGGATPANFPIEGALAGDTLAVAYVRGLALIDVSEIDRPKLLSQLQLEMKPVNVDVRDGVAAVVGSSPKPMLVLVDVRNPSAPAVIQSIALPEASYATGVSMGSEHVVVAAGAKGALVFPR